MFSGPLPAQGGQQDDRTSFFGRSRVNNGTLFSAPGAPAKAGLRLAFAGTPRLHTYGINYHTRPVRVKALSR